MAAKKKAKFYEGPMPYTKAGNVHHPVGSLMDYVDPWADKNGRVDWRENKPFEVAMRFCGFSRGRSAAHATFKDVHERHFNVFLTDLTDIIMAGYFRGNAVVVGWWVGVKRGQNYGLKYLGPEAPTDA